MTSLLLFRDNVGGVYYVPTDTLLFVERSLSYLVTIKTNVVTEKNTYPNVKVMSYTLEEAGAGAGLTDTTQVQAIYDAWEKALQNKSAIIEVALPFGFNQFRFTNSSL